VLKGKRFNKRDTRPYIFGKYDNSKQIKQYL